MYIINKGEPNIEPCGTPVIILFCVDLSIIHIASYKLKILSLYFALDHWSRSDSICVVECYDLMC